MRGIPSVTGEIHDIVTANESLIYVSCALAGDLTANNILLVTYLEDEHRSFSAKVSI